MICVECEYGTSADIAIIPAEGEAALGRSPGLRPDPAEPGPLNKALDRLQATASSLRSRLSGRAEPSVTGLSTHSRQAYI